MSKASLLLSDGESVALANGLNRVKCSRLDRGPSWLVSLPAVPRRVGGSLFSWGSIGGCWRRSGTAADGDGGGGSAAALGREWPTGAVDQDMSTGG